MNVFINQGLFCSQHPIPDLEIKVVFPFCVACAVIPVKLLLFLLDPNSPRLVTPLFAIGLSLFMSLKGFCLHFNQVLVLESFYP